MLRSRSSQNWQQGGSRAATRCPTHLRVRASRLGCVGVDVAGRRTGSAALLVRPCAPVRSRPAPRHRRGRLEREPGACSGTGCRLLCRNRADRWQDRVDSDTVRLHGDARAPRVDRSWPRSARRRGQRRRNRRPERDRRARRAVCVLRRAHDERRAGVRRPACGPAAACRFLAGSGGTYPGRGCGRRRLGGRRLTDGTGNLRAGRGRSTAVGRSGHRERSCGLDGPECCFVAGRRCAGERPRRVDRAWVRDPGPRRACGHHTGFGGSLSRTTGAVRTRTRGCPRSPARSSSPAARSECRAARTDPLGTAFASPRIVRGDVEPGAAEFAVGSCVARTAGSRSR